MIPAVVFQQNEENQASADEISTSTSATQQPFFLLQVQLKTTNRKSSFTCWHLSSESFFLSKLNPGWWVSHLKISLHEWTSRWIHLCSTLGRRRCQLLSSCFSHLCFPAFVNSSLRYFWFREYFDLTLSRLSCSNIPKYMERFWMKFWPTLWNLSWAPNEGSTHTPRKLHPSCFRCHIWKRKNPFLPTWKYLLWKGRKSSASSFHLLRYFKHKYKLDALLTYGWCSRTMPSWLTPVAPYWPYVIRTVSALGCTHKLWD